MAAMLGHNSTTFPVHPVAFPEYFPMTAQGLVRRMLVEQLTGRVELSAVVCHSWLTDYHKLSSFRGLSVIYVTGLASQKSITEVRP